MHSPLVTSLARFFLHFYCVAFIPLLLEFSPSLFYLSNSLSSRKQSIWPLYHPCCYYIRKKMYSSRVRDSRGFMNNCSRDRKLYINVHNIEGSRPLPAQVSAIHCIFLNHALKFCFSIKFRIFLIALIFFCLFGISSGVWRKCQTPEANFLNCLSTPKSFIRDRRVSG